MRAKTTREFYELYKDYINGRPVKPEDVNCNGCQSETGLFSGCELCTIRKFCHGKKLTTCAGCIDYRQCAILNGLYSVPTHRHAKVRLDKLSLKD